MAQGSLKLTGYGRVHASAPRFTTQPAHRSFNATHDQKISFVNLCSTCLNLVRNCEQVSPHRRCKSSPDRAHPSSYPLRMRSTSSGRGIGATAPYPVHFSAAATLA